jgi:hypothetical protein
MDQPSPDQPTPEPSAPERNPDITVAPTRAREERRATRLQTLVGADEKVIAWTRGWVSRERRLHRLLAARTFDFAVLTDRSLFLFSTGFFTRRPRRRVYSSRLDRLNVSNHAVGRSGRRLRITARDAHPLWLELQGNRDRTATFADALVARARAE